MPSQQINPVKVIDATAQEHLGYSSNCFRPSCENLFEKSQKHDQKAILCSEIVLFF